MNRWLVFVPVCVLLLMGLAFGQPFSTEIYFITGDPLTTTCDGSTPIPDGRIIKIFWDADSDGPDADDVQPTICDYPELGCQGGPAETVNYNEFEFNGSYWGFGEGYFFAIEDFLSAADLPDPPQYYLRVYEEDGETLLWTSTVKTLESGPQVWELFRVEGGQNDWTCGSSGPECIVIDETE